MNKRIKIQISTFDQYNMIVDLINSDYSKLSFLKNVQEKIDNDQFLGESNPKDDILKLENITHSIKSLHKDDIGILYADIKILDTMNGRAIKVLIEDEYDLILLPHYKVKDDVIIDFLSLSIDLEIFNENDIYKKIIRNNKIDSLLK